MKNRVEVVIAGNRFTMTGEQDEEYMLKIAALVDSRVVKVRENGANILQAVLLTACDMADNYVQAVQGAENLRTQISGYLAENKNLSRELADAQQEIKDMIRTASDKEKEMLELNRYKDRISELEAVIEANQSDKARIAELEIKVSDLQKRAQSIGMESETRARRVKELEQQIEDAHARHDIDLENAEKTDRELRELREKVMDSDKKQRRIEELEQELASAEKQLNEVRSRLSRLLK